jgi:beta-aspartyl-peptidase (threonine type)
VPVRAVFVHGGVSGAVKDLIPLGYAVASGLRHRHALDAVEAAVIEMEDDPALQAGFGSTLNHEGRLELDAGIADGKTGRAGGVANVTVRHPVTLARRVLERTPHVLITGAGACALGDDMETLRDTTDEQRRRWESARAEGTLGPGHFGAPDRVETVGAVALDERGRLAAASSTGGVFGKLPGRVGDSPVFGAGFYASSDAAVVGTGVGELFLETLACLQVGRSIENGEEPQAACEGLIGDLGRRGSYSAGILALDGRGRFGVAYRGGSWSVEGLRGPVEAVRVPES